jgi:hypothetical protein
MSAVDAMVVLFNALPDTDRQEAFRRMSQLHARAEAGEESDTDRMIRSLNLVAQAVGKDAVDVTITDYRTQVPLLREAGEDIVPFSELYAHFDGRWSHVTLALELAEVETSRKIEARFLSRRLGKIWRYTEDQLADTLEQCSFYYVVTYRLAEDARYAPLVSEFDHWRAREFELARARGDLHFHLPSASPYRRRYGDWETALMHFGFTPDQVAERHARQLRVVAPPAPPEKPTPDALPIAQLTDRLPSGLAVPAAQALAIGNAYRQLPPRTKYVLTARLGLGTEVLPLKWVAKPLTLHFSRIAQLQHEAIGEIAEKAGAHTREDVVQTLRQLAVPPT